MKKEKVILFGAGGRLKNCIHILEFQYEILFICDNDLKKHNQKFEGYEVHSPALLLEYRGIRVIIVSSYEDQIYNQLMQMGLDNICTLYGLPKEMDSLPHRHFLYNMIQKRCGDDSQIMNVDDIYLNWNNHWRIREIVKQTIPFGITGDEKILDYGFGCGTLVLNGLIQNQDIYGIDLDEEKKAYYDMKIDDLGYPKEWKERGRMYDGLTIPFENESFDLIYCDYVLEHVSDLYSCLSEMIRVCKNGGRIRIACPNYDASFEEHYLVDFGKSLYGHKEEFASFLTEQGRDSRQLKTIYFINMQDIKVILDTFGELKIIDLNERCPLSGINLLITKL